MVSTVLNTVAAGAGKSSLLPNWADRLGTITSYAWIVPLAQGLATHDRGKLIDAVEVAVPSLYVDAAGRVAGVPGAITAQASLDLATIYIAPHVAPWLGNVIYNADPSFFTPGVVAGGGAVDGADGDPFTGRPEQARQQQAQSPLPVPSPHPASQAQPPRPATASLPAGSVLKLNPDTQRDIVQLQPPPGGRSPHAAPMATGQDQTRQVQAQTAPPQPLPTPPPASPAQPPRPATASPSTSPVVKLNPDTQRDIVHLQPPPGGRSPQAAPAVLPPAASSGSTFAAASQQSVARSQPGGVSLSKSAAASMPIAIDLAGASFIDGVVVLSGRPDPASTLDAALFLTALRSACEPRDPYFSLDPDNGAAWLNQGQRASDDLWQRIRTELDWDRPTPANGITVKQTSLTVQTFWARRDYPAAWAVVSSKYPDLRSALVFKPDWLRETRLGEIMYRADVLLKELAAGVPVLKPGALRASGVEGYVSQGNRQIATTLLGEVRHEKTSSAWAGSRFWFDIAPSAAATVGSRPAEAGRSALEDDVLKKLRDQGLWGADRTRPAPSNIAYKQGNDVDVSQVAPAMFVKRHDFEKAEDLSVRDPIMEAFASEVNASIRDYVAQYDELRALQGVIRAYIVGVHVVHDHPRLCERLRAFPLLDAEKVARPLPRYQDSELTITAARLAVGNSRRVQTWRASSSIIQGGVTIRGRDFYEKAREGGSPILAALKADPSAAGPGLSFVAFDIGSGLPEPMPPPRTGTAGPESLVGLVLTAAVTLGLSQVRRRRRMGKPVRQGRPRATGGPAADGIASPGRFARDAQAMLLRHDRASDAPGGPARIEDDFRQVFMFADREAIIDRYRKELGCDRSAAMTRAVADWRRENRSWST